MFDFFNNEKLPRGIKKLLTPRGEFKEQTKSTFLAVFDVAHPPTHLAQAARASHGITVVAKALIVAGAFAAVLAGVSVYADTANVAADSPLYSFKRLGESVQLTLAPKQEKAELQAAFAVRRADEITDLNDRKPTSTIIAHIATDLNVDINASLNDADEANLQDGRLNNFCNKLFGAVASSSIFVHSDARGAGRAFSARLKNLDRFENRCSESRNKTKNENRDKNRDAVSSTTIGIVNGANVDVDVNVGVDINGILKKRLEKR